MKTEFLSMKQCVDLLEGIIDICYELQIDRSGRGGGQERFCVAKVWKFTVTYRTYKFQLPEKEGGS